MNDQFQATEMLTQRAAVRIAGEIAQDSSPDPMGLWRRYLAFLRAEGLETEDEATALTDEARARAADRPLLYVLVAILSLALIFWIWGGAQRPVPTFHFLKSASISAVPPAKVAPSNAMPVTIEA